MSRSSDARVACAVAGLWVAAGLSSVGCGLVSNTDPSGLGGAAGDGPGAGGQGGEGPGAGGFPQSPTGGGGELQVPENCPPFAEWEPALQADVIERTGADAPTLADWMSLDFVRIQGGMSAKGIDCLPALRLVRWEDSAVRFSASELGQLPELRSLRFENAEVDLQGVANAAQWESVIIRNVRAFSSAQLQEFPNLEEVYIDHVDAVDLTDLAGASELTNLKTAHTTVTGLSAVADMDELLFLDLTAAGVVDIAPLLQAASLQAVALASNPLNEESRETHIPALLGAEVCVEWTDAEGALQQQPPECYPSK